MEPKVITISFRPDTLEIDIDAPDLNLEVCISFVVRALRQLENMEKVLVAQNVSQAVRQGAIEADRTRRVVSNIKM